MSDLDSKIKELYDSKKLSEAKIRNIQRQLETPRRSRMLVYGPIAAIFFIAVIGKIAVSFLEHDTAMEEAKLKAAAPAEQAERVVTIRDQEIPGDSRESGASSIEIRKLTAVKSAGTAEVRNLIEVKAAVIAQVRDVKKAYNKALGVYKGLAGEAMLEFSVTAEGKVKDAVLARSELKYSVFEETLINTVREWTFRGIEKGEGRYRLTLMFNAE